MALEDDGHVVLASEAGTIPVDFQKHSYDACLAAATECDCLIAIIDGRFGGLMPDGKTSITQAEIEAALTGNRARYMLVFVRQSVWDAKEVYKAYMKSGAKFQGTKIVSDERVFQLLDWIRTRKTGNWIFQFNTLADILRIVKLQTANGRAWKKYIGLSLLVASAIAGMAIGLLGRPRINGVPSSPEARQPGSFVPLSFQLKSINAFAVDAALHGLGLWTDAGPQHDSDTDLQRDMELIRDRFEQGIFAQQDHVQGSPLDTNDFVSSRLSLKPSMREAMATLTLEDWEADCDGLARIIVIYPNETSDVNGTVGSVTAVIKNGAGRCSVPLRTGLFRLYVRICRTRGAAPVEQLLDVSGRIAPHEEAK